MILEWFILVMHTQCTRYQNETKKDFEESETSIVHMK